MVASQSVPPQPPEFPIIPSVHPEARVKVGPPLVENPYPATSRSPVVAPDGVVSVKEVVTPAHVVLHEPEQHSSLVEQATPAALHAVVFTTVMDAHAMRAQIRHRSAPHRISDGLAKRHITAPLHKPHRATRHSQRPHSAFRNQSRSPRLRSDNSLEESVSAYAAFRSLSVTAEAASVSARQRSASDETPAFALPVALRWPLAAQSPSPLQLEQWLQLALLSAWQNTQPIFLVHSTHTDC